MKKSTAQSNNIQTDIRQDFVIRMRSLVKRPQEIENLSIFLELSLQNINVIAKQ